MRGRPWRLVAALVALWLNAIPVAQEQPLLRNAEPGEAWITRPTIGAPALPQAPALLPALADDLTPPTTPGNLTAQSRGLFSISAAWSASSDPESGIAYYAFAIGTGTTSDTEANVRWWQSTGTGLSMSVNLALTPGATYYVSVRANNGANFSSATARSGPLVATPIIYGAPGNQLTYAVSPTGIDAGGGVTSSWPASHIAQMTAFLDNMLPIIRELYGPPSSSYSVVLVRDLRYTNSAIFFPSSDEIHMGDTATYQLFTHELIHAWRRDRILSADSLWQYNPTFSGFEEGFAQAVSYQAMMEFARRYPAFGVGQSIFQSSNEWDYDFQNVPELRTRDFWSDFGGTLLYWVRYEMAAAAIAKIDRQRPGFPAAFNAEYYARLNANPTLTPSRALIKDIIATVAPAIEGRPASDWIDAQYIFTCADFPGRKIFIFTQHYPASEYFIFNRTTFYETFSNGSDWAIPDGSGGYTFYNSNGSQGSAIVRSHAGADVWQTSLLISPTDNPPALLAIGSDHADMTTQASHLPWPGGDPTRLATSLTSLNLYRLTATFTHPVGATVTNTYHRVVGAVLRNTTGVFGGVVGADGGTIILKHRGHATVGPLSLVNGAFWTTAPWASLSHPETSSNDSDPGLVEVTYTDATGRVYKDMRAIGYGSWNGNQAFLFDVSRMSELQAFTDSSLSAGVNQIRAAHVTELRLRVDLARMRHGLAAYSWTDPSLTGASSPIRAIHITELRTALAQAYTAAGLTPPTYTDATIATGLTTVRAVHITELRTAVAGLE